MSYLGSTLDIDGIEVGLPIGLANHPIKGWRACNGSHPIQRLSLGWIAASRMG